jgi:hypothetical protein
MVMADKIKIRILVADARRAREWKASGVQIVKVPCYAFSLQRLRYL